MTIELDSLDLGELKQLQKDVARKITSYEDDQRSNALNAAKEAAKKHGFNLDDLYGHGSRKKRSPVANKYAHPEDPSLGWSGRGRQPAWFKELVDAGKMPEDLLIG